MSKLFMEAECLAIVFAASGRPFCCPPAKNTEPATSLAVPAGAGQGGSTTFPSRWTFEGSKIACFTVEAESYSEAERLAYDAIACSPSEKCIFLVGWESS